MHGQRHKSVRPNHNKSTSHNYVCDKQQCPLCNDSHVMFMFQCQVEAEISNQERYKVVSVHRLCIICLSPDHIFKVHIMH
jgi:hypothetical protein